MTVLVSVLPFDAGDGPHQNCKSHVSIQNPWSGITPVYYLFQFSITDPFVLPIVPHGQGDTTSTMFKYKMILAPLKPST